MCVSIDETGKNVFIVQSMVLPATSGFFLVAGTALPFFALAEAKYYFGDLAFSILTSLFKFLNFPGKNYYLFLERFS